MLLISIGCLAIGVPYLLMRQIMLWRARSREILPDSTPSMVLSAAPAGALPIGSVAAALNIYVDPQPHALIIGPTGSGKTTFTRALLARRSGRVAVLTPKPDPSDWPGVPIVTIDDDGRFSELTRAFVQLDREVRQRLVATKRGQLPGDMLTIVCDDWPVLASECGRPASDLFKMVGRLGRSLGVRLVVLSQSERVKSLGLEGEGDAKDNFVKIVLKPDHSATIDRISTDHASGVDKVIDTREAPALAADPQDPAKWWRLSTELPMLDSVEFASLPTRPTRLEPLEAIDANRLLRDALGIDGRNAETAFSSGISTVATAQTDQVAVISKRDETGSEVLESLPPDVSKRISSIDWFTVAQLVEGGIGETAALKALGFSPGSTAKYQIARDRLQAARSALRELSGKDVQA